MSVSAFYLLSEAGSLLVFIAMGFHTPEELAWDLLRNRSLILILPWGPQNYRHNLPHQSICMGYRNRTQVNRLARPLLPTEPSPWLLFLFFTGDWKSGFLFHELDISSFSTFLMRM